MSSALPTFPRSRFSVPLLPLPPAALQPCAAMTANATADVRKFFQAHSIFCEQKKYCVIEKCAEPSGIFTWLTNYNIFASRIFILNASKTPASARNRANKLRLRLCGERLLTQPPEQFHFKIALIDAHGPGGGQARPCTAYVFSRAPPQSCPAGERARWCGGPQVWLRYLRSAS